MDPVGKPNHDDRDPLTQAVIGAAIEVHRGLGPGLLESAYEACLCHELHTLGIPFKRQVGLPLAYKGVRLDCGYRLDLFVDDRLIVELKCAEKIDDIHKAQLLTYLRLAGVRTGLLLNFHTAYMRDGLLRMVL